MEGCITALVTPFDTALGVDYAGLRENVRFQIANGVSGLVPLGTTGESPTITDDEREKIVSAVVDEANGKAAVIVGAGTNSTEKTIKYARQAKDLGADAVLIVSPYYNKPTQEGLYRHFKAVNDAVAMPVIVYNIQGRTGVNIETPTLLRMSGLTNVRAVKEASGSISQMMDVIAQLPKDFIVLSGDDNMTLPLIAAGGRGVISVVSNLFPRMVSDMVSHALKGDFESARKLHYKLMPIFKTAFIETNPMPIKAAMNFAGMPAGGCRLPLCELQPQNAEKLKAVLRQYQELTIA
ncbi:MAG: 4-hydroxy-tetrahydrodipicolinate synthase [Candidatus Aenigmarchaeota archaeon]|nr:4-hydroxy-tetrahydrodipicolinate synthase [Candidatus Aenigmarchaeota archaeon]